MRKESAQSQLRASLHRVRHRYWVAGVILILLSPVVVLYFLDELWKSADRQQRRKCRREAALQFSGIVSQYTTDVFAETSTFCLNDSIGIQIPRSTKELFLSEGDTVFKDRGTNRYVVWRAYTYGRGSKQRDTIEFADCAGK